ncbi:hypothetical protein [Krasilnikovia sp. MM14-A1259]|uniref:hypothetical protein n=1 Tax=Krasilnikovia sp. MM14-A1259 TaxID=3373539 RepID=UPI0038035BEC
MRWLRLVFLVAAGLQVATIFLDDKLVPYCGTIAVAALLAMALSSPSQALKRPWTRRSALAGLTMLTVAAALSDHRTGGYGWSTDVAGGNRYSIPFGTKSHGPHAVEAVLLVAGVAALAASVLGRAERLLRWWHIPGALLGLLNIAGFVDTALHPRVFDYQIPPDLRLRFLVLLPVGLVSAALWLAANVALASRGPLRLAGAGLLAVFALAVTGYQCLSVFEPIQARSDPVAEERRWEETWRPLDSETIKALALRRRADSDPAFLQGGDDSRRASATTFGAPTATSSEEFEAERLKHLGPRSPEEARSQALAEDAHRESGIVAVPYPPSWTGDGTDWARSRPAINATFIAAGLVALVMALFQNQEGAGSRRSRPAWLLRRNNSGESARSSSVRGG